MKETGNSYRRKDALGKKTPIFNKIKAGKIGTPIGGGILPVLIVSILFLFISYLWGFMWEQTLSLLGIFLGFAAIGFLDDIKKIYVKAKDFVDLPYLPKLLLQLFIAFLFSVFIIKTGIIAWDIPLLPSGLAVHMTALIFTLTIVFMSNAFNITDGVDGLSSGLLLISLAVLFVFNLLSGNIQLVLFIGLLFGGVLAFLYFNIAPARLFMGDSGALAFGAILGVFALTPKAFWLIPIFGFLFIVEALSSQLQLFSKAVFKRKILPVAPIHHTFEAIGWSESKVAFRFWIVGIFTALLSLFLYFSFN